MQICWHGSPVHRGFCAQGGVSSLAGWGPLFHRPAGRVFQREQVIASPVSSFSARKLSGVVPFRPVTSWRRPFQPSRVNCRAERDDAGRWRPGVARGVRGRGVRGVRGVCGVCRGCVGSHGRA